MKKTMTGVVCLLAAFPLIPLAAQTITGTVFDASGAVVPSVAVTIINTDTKASQFVTGGEDGNFTVAGLAPGKYRLDFESPGFQACREYAAVKAGDTVRISPMLSLGRVRETITVTGKGTPAYAGPAKMRVGGRVDPARLLKQARMPYPEAAKARGATGSVVVRAVIVMDGSLASITTVRSPDPDLTAAAIDALKQWRYEPTKLNGKPVETETLIEVVFNLAQ